MDAITRTLRNATHVVKEKINAAENNKSKNANSDASTSQSTADSSNDTSNNNASTSLPPLPAPPSNVATSNVPPVLTEQERQNKAFENALNNTFPLTPEQIKQVMQRMNDSQQAGRAPPEPDPTPVVKIEDVPLDPGVSPPVIRVATGYVTTVNILDVTGQPWPIQDVVVGGNFQVTGPNDAQVLRIIPQTRFGRGNLSVRLVGLATPITFRVESGGSEVYYRYDARITQSGPDAKQPLIDHGFTGQAGDTTLMAFLAGTPPKDANRLTLSGTDGRTKAWKMNGMIYLRTPLTLLSPGWDSSVRSADGTSVYVLSETPILMLSDNGQMVQSRVDIPPEDPFHTNDLKEGKVTIPVSEPTVPAATPPGAVPIAGAPATATATPAANSAQNAATPTTPAQSATSPNVTKLPGGGVTIYSNGATPPIQTRTNIPINVNVGGSGS
jgi:intracellular multiplication protein IcmK